jgi:hypothetical protein
MKKLPGGFLGANKVVTTNGPWSSATATGKFSTDELLQAKLQNNRSPSFAVSRSVYGTAGTFSWVAPTGATKANVMVVGGGGGALSNNAGSVGAGGGGGLGWKNCICVTPGSSYTLVVGAGGAGRAGTGTATTGGTSYFVNTSTVAGYGGVGGSNSGGAGGCFTGDGGGPGGTGSTLYYYGNGGGGGAGGYMGGGGNGIYYYSGATPLGNPGSCGGGSGGVSGAGMAPSLWGAMPPLIPSGGGPYQSFGYCTYINNGSGGTATYSYCSSRSGYTGVAVITTGPQARFPTNVMDAPTAPNFTILNYRGLVQINMNGNANDRAAYYVCVAQPGNILSISPPSYQGLQWDKWIFQNLPNATTFTFTVYGVNSAGISPPSATQTWTTGSGSQIYNSTGTYSWVAPTNVTSVSVVMVGSGATAVSSSRGGGGASLRYVNNYSVTPGSSYTVGVNQGSTKDSYWISTGTVIAGGTITSAGGTGSGGCGGGNGGSNTAGRAGAGAGGYTGAGGNASSINSSAGTSGSGGGGGSGASTFSGSGSIAGGGGGVGIYGQGASGAGGTFSAGYAAGGGGGGSGCGGYSQQGGNSGGQGIIQSGHTCCSSSYCCYYSGGGGQYGGGGASTASGTLNGGYGGVVRIVYPGNLRQFPSTNVTSP